MILYCTGVRIGHVVTTLPGIGGGIVHPALSGEILGFQIGEKLDGTDREKHGTGLVEEREFFLFTINLVFNSLFYKGTSKCPFLFELMICLHQVQIKG